MGPKGGLRGIPTAREQKGKSHAERSGREKAQTGRPSAPACFLCLDRPSRYVLEPCGHRVVCGECAVQLVEAVVRNRAMSDAAGGAHYASQGGGACPSCGMAIT